MAKPSRTARRGGNVRQLPYAEDAGFWDRPVTMNLVADLLYLAGGALLLWSAWVLVQRMPVFPLREVVVTSPLRKVDPVALEEVGTRALSGNFFTVDLVAARQAFAGVPWVRQVELRRRWPDAIEISVEEHEAVARWQDGSGVSRLVNRHGEVFDATLADSLPTLVGGEGAAARMLERLREINQRLTPIDRRVAALALSARDAWRLRLDDGTAVDLGRDRQGQGLEQRLARLIATYPELRARAPLAFNTVDLRYPNGFVVRRDARS